MNKKKKRKKKVNDETRRTVVRKEGTRALFSLSLSLTHSLFNRYKS